MKFCSNCGQQVELSIPEGDDRQRHCCGNCGSIHYQNPKTIVGCLPIWEGRILMCRRGIEPRRGYWTLPAGFMELGETTEEGAVRETWEETRAQVDIKHLHGVYNIPEISQVYMIYLAQMRSPDFEVTPESTEIKLCLPNEIPWSDIAFWVMKMALEQYLGDDQPDYKQVFHRDLRFPDHWKKRLKEANSDTCAN